MKEYKTLQKLLAKLLRSQPGYFPLKGPVRCSEEHGVYVIYSPKGMVLHVGKTARAKKGLDQRLQNHITNNSSFSIHYLENNGKRLRRGYKFKYVLVSKPRLRALLEAYVTGRLCPAHIGTGEKRID
jgi:hypothetical protein